jgi:hypothetical protein
MVLVALAIGRSRDWRQALDGLLRSWQNALGASRRAGSFEQFTALDGAGLHQVGRGPRSHMAYRLMTAWWVGLTSGAG